MTRRTLSVPLLAFLLGSAACAAPGRAEDSVLVYSTEARYVPGTILTEDRVLDLPGNASAVILFQSGEMLRLTGPYQGTLGQARPAEAPTGMAGLVASLREQGIDAAPLGASRSVSPSAHRARVEPHTVIDPQRSAIYCLGTADTVWLERPARPSGRIALRGGRQRRQLSWPEGTSQVEWPPDLPIADGDHFDVLDSRDEPLATLIFRRMVPPASDTAWIAESYLLGCRDQAEHALEELQHALAHQIEGR